MAINEGFFEKFPGLMKKLFVNEGAMERGTESAMFKNMRKEGRTIRNNAESKADLKSTISDLRNVEKTMGAENNGDRAILRKMKNDGVDINDAQAASKHYTDNEAALEKYARRGSVKEAAKDYFANPIKNLKSTDDATRHMAVGQLAARGGAVAAGTVAVGSMAHDLFASDENDVGFGGGVGNTIGAGALGAGGAAAAAGMSMLKKL